MGKTKRDVLVNSKRKSTVIEKALSKLSLQQEKISKQTKHEEAAMAVSAIKQAAAQDPSEAKAANKKNKKKSKFAESIEEVTRKLQQDSGKFAATSALAPFEIVPFASTKRKQKTAANNDDMFKSNNAAINPKLFEHFAAKNKKQQEQQQQQQQQQSELTLPQSKVQDDLMEDDDERSNVPDAPGMFFRSKCMLQHEQETGKKLPTQDRTLFYYYCDCTLYSKNSVLNRLLVVLLLYSIITVGL